MNVSKNQVIENMLLQVANALGADLLEDMAFLGGCATGLHITDASTLNDIRMTDDVDLVVSVVGYAGWAALQETLRSKGFRDCVFYFEKNIKLLLATDGWWSVDLPDHGGMRDDQTIIELSHCPAR